MAFENDVKVFSFRARSKWPSPRFRIIIDLSLVIGWGFDNKFREKKVQLDKCKSMQIICICKTVSTVPFRKLTYPFPKALLKMSFLFPRWDMSVPWRVPIPVGGQAHIYIYICIHISIYISLSLSFSLHGTGRSLSALWACRGWHGSVELMQHGPNKNE